MFTVLYGSSDAHLRDLVRFYQPDAQAAIDVTYGAGTLSRLCPCPVVGIDQDPTTSPTYFADARTDLTELFPEPCFDVGIYDPPYLYGSKAMHMGPVGAKTWNSTRTTWKDPLELRETSVAVGLQLVQVLHPHGIVIVKIADARHKKTLVRNDQVVIDAFEHVGWRLHDRLVYIRTMVNSYKNDLSATAAHGYFLVFKRWEGK